MIARRSRCQLRRQIEQVQDKSVRAPRLYSKLSQDTRRKIPQVCGDYDVCLPVNRRRQNVTIIGVRKL